MGSFDQGFAFGAGFPARAAQERQALSEEEHEQALADYNNKINNTQQRLSILDKSSPDYAPMRQQLNQLVADRTMLFHPDQPGGLERLGRMLWEKVHGKPETPTAPARISTQTDAATPGTTLPPMPGATASVSVPSLPATTETRVAQPPIQHFKSMAAAMQNDAGLGLPVQENRLLTLRTNLRQALPNISDEDLDKALLVAAGVEAKPLAAHQLSPAWKLYKLPDGTYRNFNLNDPEHQPPDGSIPVTGQTQPHQSTAMLQWYLRTKYGDNPTPQQMEEGTANFKKIQAGDTNTIRETILKDLNGVPHIITLRSHTQKDFPAASKAKSEKRPKSAGEAKRNLGQLDFHTATPASNAAGKALDAAESSYLDVQKASADPTPVGDKGIILAWLRGRVNRVTATEIQSVNSLGGAQFALENGVARILQGKMSDAQRQWFLRSARDNYDIAKKVASKYGLAGSSDADSSDIDDIVKALNGTAKGK